MESSSSSSKKPIFDLADPTLELLDPTPDIFAQFVLFNEQFFFAKLGACTVEWSKRLTSCAGICQFHPRTGLCTIRLSEPLLKLRPRKDFVETLLHEMIHAYLFITSRNQDRDGHGPEFQYHMVRINGLTGINITIYHSFHAEVAVYKQHWWRCNGLCQDRAPFYGWVKRAMNRAPGPNDTWWKSHKDTCPGVFIKVKEPEKSEKIKKESGTRKSVKEETPATPKINSIFLSTGQTLTTSSAQFPKNVKDKNHVVPSLDKGNTIGFTRVNTGFQGAGMSQQSRSTVFSQKSVSKKRKSMSTEIIDSSQTKIDTFFKGVGHKLGSSEVSTIDFKIKEEDSSQSSRIRTTPASSLTGTKKQKKKPDIIILGL